MKKVGKDEYLKFIGEYPRRLERDVCGISEPPLVTYNDFTRGKWPESVVAKEWLCPESEREYYILGEE